MPERDLVVIGASAGGIEAVRNLLARLPTSLEAAVLVVIHVPDVPSLLPETLARKSQLPVRFARDGDPLQRSQALVAPPNHHLLLEANDRVRLAQTARENGFRPAVDPLFRTAAWTAGARVIGVVLSGALDDGAAGLSEIVRRGGVAIVQDFDEALLSSMPRSAAQQVRGALVLPIHEIALMINKLATGSAVAGEQSPAPSEEPDWNERKPAHLSCPQRGGVLRGSSDASPIYACHVGHTYAPEALAAEQSDEVDRALWSALRVLRESAAVPQSMALSEAYVRRAQEAEGKADAIRRVFESQRRQTDV
jgi:two-component system, chemotaxis family, protein-glutamate methylesterase/glutaminase